MAYCTNCGHQISDTTKFCPNCGVNVNTVTQNKEDAVPPPPKRSVQKGVVKSLKNQTSNYLKKKTKETVKPNLSKKDQTRKEFSEPTNEIESTEKKDNKIATKWMIYYFIITIILTSLYGSYEEVQGISIFSIIIIITYFFRRNKDKPFNIVLKIFLVLQVLLVFSTLMTNLQYLENGNSLFATLLLAPLCFVIIMLIIKGNKNQRI